MRLRCLFDHTWFRNQTGVQLCVRGGLLEERINVLLLCCTFSALITRANDWLRKNGHVRVKTCESIEVKGRYDGLVDTNKSSYFEADHTKRKMRNMYIRALRYFILTIGLNDILNLGKQWLAF